MIIMLILLILARIAWVTPQIAKLQGQPITYETFNKDTKTYCDVELRDRSFLAPKIVTAFLEFVETHKEEHSNPYTEQEDKHTDQKGIEAIFSGPEIIKVWSYEYTAEEIRKKLEQYFKKDAIKVSTVAATIVEWHKKFTASLYTKPKDYVNEHVFDLSAGLLQTKCREEMYLQIILHIITFPDSQREKIFQIIFQTQDSMPNRFMHINTIWFSYREKLIRSYYQNPKENVDSKLLRILNEYSSVDGFLCDHYNSDKIHGPRQLENMYEKIISNSHNTIQLWEGADENTRLKADLYIGHVTKSYDFSAEHAAIFYKWVITLLHQRLQLQDQTGDVGMQLLFNSLSKSRLNYCLIGGVLRFFQLFSSVMKSIDNNGRASADVFRSICMESYPWEDNENVRIHELKTWQYCVRSDLGRNRENVQRIVNLMTSEWDSDKALDYWRSCAWESQQPGINEVPLSVYNNENSYPRQPIINQNRRQLREMEHIKPLHSTVYHGTTEHHAWPQPQHPSQPINQKTWERFKLERAVSKARHEQHERAFRSLNSLMAKPYPDETSR